MTNRLQPPTILSLVVVFFFSAAAPAVAEEPCHAWPLRDDIAYDGDTVRITMPGLPPPIDRMSVRVRGIDTPEMRGKCPEEKALAVFARDTVRTLLSEAESVLFCDPEWGRYGGRVVATVLADGRDLAAILVERALGRPYEGGSRAGWCGQ